MTCYKIHTLRPTIVGRLFEKFGMEPSLSYNQYRLISTPGEPQKLELASQVEIQKLRIQVEPGIDLTKRKSGMHFFEMQVETKKN